MEGVEGDQNIIFDTAANVSMIRKEALSVYEYRNRVHNPIYVDSLGGRTKSLGQITKTIRNKATNQQADVVFHIMNYIPGFKVLICKADGLKIGASVNDVPDFSFNKTDDLLTYEDEFFRDLGERKAALLGCLRDWQYKFELKPGAEPVWWPSFEKGEDNLRLIDEYVESLWKEGLIEDVDPKCQWNTRLMLVSKAGTDEKRVVVDLRNVNDLDYKSSN